MRGHLAVVELLMNKGVPVDTVNKVSFVAMTLLVLKRTVAVALHLETIPVYKNIIFVDIQRQQSL